MVVFSKTQSSSDNISAKRKYNTKWDAFHIKKKTTNHYDKKTNEETLRLSLTNKIYAQKKCCCDKCLLTLVDRYGLDLTVKSILTARESIYYSNQIDAHT